jgi:hypothetical protein
MKYPFYVILLLIFSLLSLDAQTVVSVQNEITKNLKQYEFEFLDGSHFSKKFGEQWNIQKKENKLKVTGSNENSMITVATFLDGRSYYTTDNQIWHKKSFVINNTTDKISHSRLTARFNDLSNAIDIEYHSIIDGNANFYLMPLTGANRIILGSSFVLPGINLIQFNLDEVNRGNYFLIVDQNSISSLCKIIIF